MTSEIIRDYCKEALSITEEQGIQEGLAFLIGEKFSLVYYQLKNAHNKLKYLYPGSTQANQKNPILKGNKTLQLSYTLTINENYRSVFERVGLLEEALELPEHVLLGGQEGADEQHDGPDHDAHGRAGTRSGIAGGRRQGSDARQAPLAPQDLVKYEQVRTACPPGQGHPQWQEQGGHLRS